MSYGGRAWQEQESSRGHIRDRSSMDFYNGRNQQIRRRNDGDGYQNNYEYHPHARQNSQSWDPHTRYPSSSRDDSRYHRQERDSSSYHRKRSRSPDSNNQNRYHGGFDRSGRHKSIGGGRLHDESHGRRPLGSTNGAEMQIQRAAPPHHQLQWQSQYDHYHHQRSATHGRHEASYRQDEAQQQPQHRHYHHPMRRHYDASSRRDSSSRSPHGQVRMQAPQFNKINNVPELIQTAYASLSIMRPPNTAAFWNSLAKLMDKNNQLNSSNEQMGTHINQLIEHTRSSLKTFGPKDLSRTIYSMAKLFVILRKSRSSSCIVSSLSNLLLKNGRVNDDLFLSLSNASVREMNQFNAQSLSNLAYAYALVEYVPKFDDGSDLFDHIAMQSIKMKAEFNPQDVSNMVWAYATVKKRHDALFKAMGDQVVAHGHLRAFRPQHLSNIVWAYATAGVNHPKLFEKIANHILGLDNLRDFKPQTLSITVWAFATAQVSHAR
ncbi:hypothetical protein ACHAWC_002520, partial [Mediolabrus comicus]